MSVTSVGIALGAASLICFAIGRTRWLLVAGLIAPFGAVVVSESNGVSTFQAASVVVVIAALTVTRPLPAAPAPGRLALVLFAAWATLMTLVGPVIFSGKQVLPPSAGAVELQYAFPDELEFSITNLSQISYLILAIVMVFGVVRFGSMTTRVLGVGLTVAAVLSAVAYAHLTRGTPWVTGIFEGMPNARYIDVTSEGIRNRGVWSEPSGLALGSVALLAYVVGCLISPSRPRLVILGGMAAVAVFNIATAESFTAYAGGVLVAGLALVWVGAGFFAGRVRIPPTAALIAIPVIGALVLLIPELLAVANSAIFDKSGTTSFATRTGVDQFAFGVLFDSYGMGVGLGSTRTFSLWANVLAGTGVVGTLLFATMLIRLAVAGYSTPAARPAVAVMLATVLAKSVAGAALTDPILWISIAIVASHVWLPRTPVEGSPGESADSSRTTRDGSAFRATAGGQR